MVFIRKKLVEDDFTTKTASELVDAGIEKIASQDTPATDAPSTPTTEDADEVSGKSTVSMGDAKLTPDQEAEIEDIASLGESSSYNWNEILTILADYVNLDVIQQIEDDWMQNYPDGKMSQEDVDDLLNDIDESSYTEELKNEIKSRIEQLQSSSDELVGESETLEEGSNAKIDTLLKRKQISIKTGNRLKNAGIDTIGKLEELPFKEVVQILGAKTLVSELPSLLQYVKIDTSRFEPQAI